MSKSASTCHQYMDVLKMFTSGRGHSPRESPSQDRCRVWGQLLTIRSIVVYFVYISDQPTDIGKRHRPHDVSKRLEMIFQGLADAELHRGLQQ